MEKTISRAMVAHVPGSKVGDFDIRIVSTNSTDGSSRLSIGCLENYPVFYLISNTSPIPVDTTEYMVGWRSASSDDLDIARAVLVDAPGAVVMTDDGYGLFNSNPVDVMKLQDVLLQPNIGGLSVFSATYYSTWAG